MVVKLVCEKRTQLSVLLYWVFYLQDLLTFQVFGLIETMHCLRLPDAPVSRSPSSTGAETQKHTVINVKNTFYSPFRMNVNYNCLPIQGHLASSRNIRAKPSWNTSNIATNPNNHWGAEKLKFKHKLEHTTQATHSEKKGRVENVLYCPGKRVGVNDKLIIWNWWRCCERNRRMSK